MRFSRATTADDVLGKARQGSATMAAADAPQPRSRRARHEHCVWLAQPRSLIRHHPQARKTAGIDARQLSLTAKSCPVRGLEKPNNTHHPALPPEPNKGLLLAPGAFRDQLNAADARPDRRRPPHRCRETRRLRTERKSRNHAPRPQPAPQVLVRLSAAPVQGEEAERFPR